MHCYICNFFVLLTHECFRKNCFFVFVFFSIPLRLMLGASFPWKTYKNVYSSQTGHWSQTKATIPPKSSGFSHGKPMGLLEFLRETWEMGYSQKQWPLKAASSPKLTPKWMMTHECQGVLCIICRQLNRSEILYQESGVVWSSPRQSLLLS